MLLRALTPVMLDRIATRNDNDYGKRDDERSQILHDLAWVEPILGSGCTHEIDAARPLDEVVEAVLEAAMMP